MTVINTTNLKVNRRKLVFSTAIAWIIFRLFVIAARGINIGFSAVSPLSFIELAVIVSLLIWLHRGAQPERVAIFLLLTLTAPLLLFTYTSGGLQGPVVVVGLFFPVMAFLLIGRRGGWLACILLVTFFIVVSLLNVYSDFFPENILSVKGRYIAKAFSLSMVTLLLSWIGWYYAKLHDSQMLELQRKNTELERIAQYRQDFLANISHEFRTPLNSIIGFTRRVLKTQSETLDQRSIDALKTVMRTGSGLNDLVNQILDISKLESGSVTLNNQSLEVFPWLQEQCDVHRTAAEEKGLSLNLETTEAAKNLRVTIDASKLCSLLTNIIGNAIKYTQQGSITITLSTVDKDTFCVDIKDTGTGIPEDRVATLFDKFSRLDQHEKSNITGTGLGLAIVEEILKLLEGNVSVQSTINEGSCFSLFLPIEARTIE